jgi:hypothetical protein
MHWLWWVAVAVTAVGTVAWGVYAWRNNPWDQFFH